MRHLLFIVFIFVVFFEIFSKVSALQPPGHNLLVTKELEDMFMSEFGSHKGIFYQTVPRGLIISFQENYFFDENFIVKKDILGRIANLIKRINLPCSIEVNTKTDNSENSLETSILRSQLIARDLIKIYGIKPEQIRAIGFGDMVPYKNSGQWDFDMDNRVDIVIFYY